MSDTPVDDSEDVSSIKSPIPVKPVASSAPAVKQAWQPFSPPMRPNAMASAGQDVLRTPAVSGGDPTPPPPPLHQGQGMSPKYYGMTAGFTPIMGPGMPFLRSPVTPYATQADADNAALSSFEHLMGAASGMASGYVAPNQPLAGLVFPSDPTENDIEALMNSMANSGGGGQGTPDYSIYSQHPSGDGMGLTMIAGNNPEYAGLYTTQGAPSSKSSKKRKVSSGSTSPQSRKRGDKAGSSCHQCKSRQEKEGLSYCMNQKTNLAENSNRPCRKKYCDACLLKFYKLTPPLVRHEPSNNWPCPSCRKICTCAACKKARDKAAAEAGVEK